MFIKLLKEVDGLHMGWKRNNLTESSVDNEKRSRFNKHSPSISHSQTHAQKTALSWDPGLLHRNHHFHRATASTLAADHLYKAQNME